MAVSLAVCEHIFSVKELRYLEKLG